MSGWSGSPHSPRNSCESVNTAARPPLCGQLQGKGAELLLGLMDYLFIDGLLFILCVCYARGAFILCFSSALVTPKPIAA